MTAPPQSNLRSMIDPRSDELDAYIGSLASAWEQAAAMLTLAFAFPVLHSCGDWMNRIAALEDAMHLNTTERADLQAMAAAMAEDLMAPHLSRLMYPCVLFLFARAAPLSPPPNSAGTGRSPWNETANFARFGKNQGAA